MEESDFSYVLMVSPGLLDYSEIRVRGLDRFTTFLSLLIRMQILLESGLTGPSPPVTGAPPR
jgi:hypothetical protein